MESSEETQLSIVDSLTQDHYDTIIKFLRNGFSKTSSGVRQRGLSQDSFRSLLANTLGMHSEDERILVLCKKIDSNEEEFITEEKFLNYVLHCLNEKETIQNKVPIPFQDPPTFKHNVFSKKSPCRLMRATQPPSIFTISKDGVITTWSPSLVILRGTIVDDKATMIDRSQLARLKRSNLWVTDTAIITVASILVVSTTSRELNFYDVSSTVYKCQSRLCDLPRVPLCMFSYSKPSGGTYLLYGDEAGNIVILQFHDPLASLFATNSKDFVSPLEDIQMVLFSRLSDHSQFVSITVLNQVHSDWVHHIMYLPHNHSVISSSGSSDSSLVIRHMENKRKPYVFKISKGISCFDYSFDLELLVTGSADHVVRFWDPYVTSRPVATLVDHRSPIVDVIIHNEMGVVFSYSQDKMLCAWEIKEQTLLQTVTVRFPFSQRQPDYGKEVLFLLSPSVLTVSCNEYIGEYQLGTAGSLSSQWSVVSHSQPLTAAVYDSRYDQVVSGSEGGEICVWDISTGTKLLKIKEAHGDKEITCLIMDQLSRRLVTGSSNGEVKVWNHVSGECLKSMSCPGNTEVTGLVHLQDKAKFLATGWNRTISSFSDDSDIHLFNLSPEQAWQGPAHHKDDITTMTFCPPHYLATGSFDGDIIVWNTNTQRHVAKLKSSKQQPAPFLNLRDLRKRSLFSNSSGMWSPHYSQSIASSQHPSRPSSCLFSRPSSRHLSRTSSRRLSTYSLKSTCANLHHAPVDTLLFLKSRMSSRLKLQATLVSSECGHAQFWAFPGEDEPYGTFCLSSQAETNVLALTTDSNNQFLIAGDITGAISVFDINNYCNGFSKGVTPPVCKSTWLAHAAEILSLELVSHHQAGPLVLSASADCTVRLWTIKGHYIGTFGQKHAWNLSDKSSYQHPRTPWGEFAEESPLPMGGMHTQGSNSENNSSIKPKIGRTDNRDQDTELAKELSLAPSIASGPSSLVSSHSSLPPIIDNKLSRQYFEREHCRIENKVKRRQNFSEIDVQSVERFGLLCSPYQALQLLSINDASIPNSIADVIHRSTSPATPMQQSS